MGLACWEGHHPIVLVLLALGVDPNTRNVSPRWRSSHHTPDPTATCDRCDASAWSSSHIAFVMCVCISEHVCA